MTSTPEPIRTPFAILLAAPSPAEGIERVYDEFPEISFDELKAVATHAQAVWLAQLAPAPPARLFRPCRRTDR